MTTGRAVDEGLPRLLSAWLPHQRWYPAKEREVSLRVLASLTLPGPPGVDVATQVVGLDSGDRTQVVQVPLTCRAQPLAGAEGALLGVLAGRHVYDGPADPAYVAALVASLQTPPGASPPGRPTSSRVLTGEQSNTTVVVDADGPEPFVVKVFRTLHPGENPDVTVVAALAAQGCRRVPRPVGWAGGSWRTGTGQVVTGHLAVANEFLAGSRDGWAEALAAAEAGADFSRQAHQVGTATAQVHAALAQAFGHAPPSRAQRAALVEALRARVRWALDGAPALAPYRSALTTHAAGLGALAGTALPDLQRVHGDYHLGQLLHSPTRGWVLLDFEGEPLRPLAERTQPDVPGRDVVAMLRSFDYAAARGGAGAGWAGAAGEAFLAGYAETSGHDVRAPAGLWQALWLDKALYEVVYESQNRPGWVRVPLAAVAAALG